MADDGKSFPTPSAESPVETISREEGPPGPGVAFLQALHLGLVGPQGIQSQSLTGGSGWSFLCGSAAAVVGGSRLEVFRLRAEHRRGVAAFAKKGEDKSPYNLSSIVVLAEMNEKRMLLTGDALGRYVTDGLEKAGKMKDGKIRLDLLKMPHHGSSRNTTPEFFQKVTADHYVFSADGDVTGFFCTR